MPEQDTIEYTGSTIGDAWNACIQWQLGRIRERYEEPDYYLDPVLTEVGGNVAIKTTRKAVDQIGGVLFVASEMTAGDVIPIRYLLGQQGMTQAIAIPFSTNYSNYHDQVDLVVTWILDFKATLVSSLTSATLTTPVYTSVLVASQFMETVTITRVIVGDDMAFVSVDAVRGVGGSEGTAVQVPSAPPVQPDKGAIANAGGVSLGPVVSALQDIALRDFNISFNHGAQQLSATGKVAIP